MSDLAKLQQAFRTAILGAETAAPDMDAAIEAGRLSAGQRLNVYRNNYRIGLTDSLAEIFPMVAAFVGSQFLKGALRRYILAEPPSEPMLYRYGAGFPGFLETFDPAQAVPYVADLSRVEWAIHELQNAREADVLSPEAAPVALRAGKAALSRNARLVVSRYPVVSLWMVGRGQLPPEAVHLDQGGQIAAVVLKDSQVHLWPLEGGVAELALALQEGGTGLGDAQYAHGPVLAERGLIGSGEEGCLWNS